MSGSITINGQRVTKASVTIPMYGAWTADVDIEGASTMGSVVTLVMQGLSLVGTVTRQSVFAGTRKLRIVAGGGGWRKTIPPRGYSGPLGVKLSSVLSDAASDSGETVSVGSDTTLGAFYTRDRGKASKVLRLLVGGVWYIDNAGVTQVKDRATSAIASPFQVISWDGGRGSFQISTETYEDWVPGRTFSTNTVSEAQTISSVTFDADNEGKVRLQVLTADAYRERLLADFRAIVRDELASLNFLGVYEYVIAANPISPGIFYTVDASPVDSRMPSLTRVPLATELGKVCPPALGTKCRIRFVNGNPSRPEVISFDSFTEHLMTIEAFTVVMHNLILLMAAFATPPAWLASGVTPTMINAAIAAAAIPSPPGLILQIANAAVQAGAMASGPGSTSTLYTAAITAAFSGKLPDVSGLFPSIGLQNNG